MIYADQRWIGNHGIGRFARNVLAEMPYSPVPISGHPAAPLDSVRLHRRVRAGDHRGGRLVDALH
ncbi:MAG TPA: hypothetical protein VLV49_02740 [Terriglobales bacterium]|nr:hypothetical protein [Terriglobales bacterium]